MPVTSTTPLPTEITLTEVETCMLRIALRDKAESTPHRTDGGLSKRDYYNLASRLDHFVKAHIGHGR